VQTDTNTKAYYIETTNNGYAQLTEVNNEGHDIPAYTAVVLINSAMESYAILPATSGLSSVVSENDNMLKGTLTEMTLDLSDETPYYSMGKKDDKIGFYKFSGGAITLGANKAYLESPTPSPVKGFTFDLDDDPDAIVSPHGETEEGAAIYNLAGQRLSKPQHGVNIINGKKVFIK
jgi:hypothetical protein